MYTTDVLKKRMNDGLYDDELAKLREITVDSALNDATTLPKPILNKLIDKAINENLWSDDDINNFNDIVD